jgi:hypothetical protein
MREYNQQEEIGVVRLIIINLALFKPNFVVVFSVVVTENYLIRIINFLHQLEHNVRLLKKKKKEIKHRSKE